VFDSTLTHACLISTSMLARRASEEGRAQADMCGRSAHTHKIVHDIHTRAASRSVYVAPQAEAGAPGARMLKD